MSAEDSKPQEHSTEPSTKDFPAAGDGGTSGLTTSSDVSGDNSVSSKPPPLQQSASRSTEV